MAGWLRLESLGVVDLVRQRLRLERKDGCCGQELFGLLFLMFMAVLQGQRALQRAAAHCKKALAEVLGARTFRSQASMSRALQSVTAEQSRAFSDWLLGEALEVGDLDRDDSVYHVDTFGQRWRMVDFDGRVHAIRRRGLTESPERPEPRRRSAALTAPGYSGRKRGEAQYHRMVVQDAGTARYLGVRLGPGNGAHRADMSWAVERVGQWADELDVSRNRICARFDGKASGLPSLLDCERAGIGFLTRWTEYDLFERLEVETLLEQGTWQVVGDSGSGPRREAMELGVRSFGLHVDDRPPDDERTHFEARLVVSRYRADSQEHRGTGRKRGAFVYELYITSLPAAAWPAGELVELYYGRVVEENRFEQTDGEQGIQRVITWHLPGQELAIAVSLFAWNLRLTWGTELSGWRPTTTLQPHLRRPTLVSSTHHESPSSPCPDSESPQPEPESRTDDSQPTAQQPHETETSRSPRPYRCYIGRDLISAVRIAELEWSELLKERLGWSWAPQEQELRCPAGESMHLLRARQQTGQRLLLIFRIRKQTACQACSQRASCTSSTSPSFLKELAILTDTSVLTQLLGERTDRSKTLKQGFTLAANNQEQSGPWSTRAPTLIPSVLRQQPTMILKGCRLTASAPPAPITTRPPLWSAPTPELRQHRRASYDLRDSRCLVPADHPIEINIHTPSGRPALRFAKVITANSDHGNYKRIK